ncbi:MAG TPA: hypothetical protein VJQ26_04255, partial [Ktedonobacteraceae bacterium]|nr:hypothetical protein [Ktedonobacteraceae bacterium]
MSNLISTEEKALSSDGERGYLVEIVVVPVLSSVAGVERIQNAPPLSINARQVDNPVDDDRWRKRDPIAQTGRVMRPSGVERCQACGEDDVACGVPIMKMNDQSRSCHAER